MEKKKSVLTDRGGELTRGDRNRKIGRGQKLGNGEVKKRDPRSRVSRSRLRITKCSEGSPVSQELIMCSKMFWLWVFHPRREGGETGELCSPDRGVPEKLLNKGRGCFEAHLEMLIRLEKPLFTSFQPHHAMVSGFQRKVLSLCFQFQKPSKLCAVWS